MRLLYFVYSFEAFWEDPCPEHAPYFFEEEIAVDDTVMDNSRYFITSLTDVNEFVYAVRKHWSIENQLCQCLGVIFHEDVARAGKGNSTLNMNNL